MLAIYVATGRREGVPAARPAQEAGDCRVWLATLTSWQQLLTEAVSLYPMRYGEAPRPSGE
jgi:hypothetical protein